MNKKLTAVAGMLILVIGAAFAYLLLQDTPTAPVRDSKQTTSSNHLDPTTPSSKTTGEYIEYSETKLTQTSGTKILFFHAAWCPQCRQLETDIKNGDIPADVTIFKVDYDANQNLRQKYGVRLQTTLVRVDDDGSEVEKFVAYDDPTLAAVVENLL